MTPNPRMIGRILATLILLLGTPLSVHADSPAIPRVTLLATADSRGELQPCHCPGSPAGGLSRRSGVFRHARSVRGAGVIAVDGGDLVPGADDETVDGLDHALLQVLPLLAYDAICPGERDLIRGAAFVTRLADALPLVCANLQLDGIPAWRTVERNGLTIAITGVVDPVLFYELPDAFSLEDIQLRDPAEALDALRDQLVDFDMVVVLAHTPLDGLLDLGSDRDWVTVWVHGHEPGTSPQPGRVGSAPVLEPGPRARTVAQLDLEGGASGWTPVHQKIWDLKRVDQADPRVDKLLDSLFEPGESR